MCTLIVPPYSRTATTSPSWTVCPSRTLISLTAPARGASTGISIFIDSRMITATPAATRSRGFVVTSITTRVICALISSGIEGSLFEQLRVHTARPELVARDDPAEERNGGPQPLNPHTVGGCHNPLRPLLPRGPVGDKLEEQRVVVHGDRAPRLDPGLDPNPFSGWQIESLHRAGGGQKALRRVLSIHSAFDGHSVLRDLALTPWPRLSRRDQKLSDHEVDARHFLLDSALALEPGVHLEEVEVSALTHEEFHRAGVRVADRAGAGDGRGREPRLAERRQVRRRRLLHKPLIAALDRALALVEVHDLPRAVPKHLDFHVPGTLEIALDVELPGAERCLGTASRHGERTREIRGLVDPCHADTPATRRRLEEHREADVAGDGLGPADIRHRLEAAGQHGDAGSRHQPARFDLVAHPSDRLRPGADELNSGPVDGVREPPVLGEKAVARLDRVGPRLARRRGQP